MKKFLAFVSFLALVAAAPFAMAQDSPPSVAPATPPMSAEDAARLREQLKQIGVVFGVEQAGQQPASPGDNGQQASPAAAVPQKNMAEVADRALSIVSGLVASVSKTVEKAAPEVWRIMIRQQYAKAFADLVVPWSMCLFMVAWWAFSKKKIGYPVMASSWRDEDWGRFWFSVALPSILGFAFFIWGVNRFADSAKYLINPEYYAVRDILIMVMQPGQIR